MFSLDANVFSSVVQNVSDNDIPTTTTTSTTIDKMYNCWIVKRKCISSLLEGFVSFFSTSFFFSLKCFSFVCHFYNFSYCPTLLYYSTIIVIIFMILSFKNIRMKLYGKFLAAQKVIKL